MPSQTQIREDVTTKIVQALESNLLPWRRPWATGGSQPGRHSNVSTKRPYQGVNPILLELHALQLGLGSRWWGTFNQWHELGGRIHRRPTGVEEGHWGCRVVLWKPVTKTVVDTETGDEEDERFYILRTFTVFCADQVEGEGAEQFQVSENHAPGDSQPDFAPAEDLIAATGAAIHYGGNRAYYVRPIPDGTFPNHSGGDYIMLPPRVSFNPPGSFYETAIHELAHWSEVRTSWDYSKNGYALGELAAEIVSCYVSAELGIPLGETLQNHAAYVQHWLSAMKNDRNYIFKAAKQASKVTDFLLGFVRQPEPVQGDTKVLA